MLLLDRQVTQVFPQIKTNTKHNSKRDSLPARGLSAVANAGDLDATLLTKFVQDSAPKPSSSFSSSSLSLSRFLATQV
jgi:hypothetical protein